MDNFSLKIVANGVEKFKLALSLFPHKYVVGYREEKDKRLVFYWTDSEKATKLPFPMSLEQAANFALGWLSHQNYGKEPDHDGDNSKGWCMYNQAWGYIDNEWQAFVAIEPAWAQYGK